MMRIYISPMACDSLKNYLKNQGYQLEYVTCPKVYTAIEHHPDILYCHLVSNLFKGKCSNIGPKYPQDICYNAACTGKFFIHNLKYTDKELLETAKNMNMTLVNVKQGYTKCNIVVVSEDAIITSDMGIYKACIGLMKVLLISPDGVSLAHMNRGFLGGASGRVGNSIVFNGDLSRHEDFERIVEFIKNEGLEVVWFDGAPLYDIGSIISEENFK